MSALRIFAVLTILTLCTTVAHAQFTWDGGLSHGNFTVNSNWTTPNNWVSGAVPTSSVNTAITFAQSGSWTTASQNIADPFILNSITIASNNTNFTMVEGSPLDFHTNSSSAFPVITQSSSTGVTISNNINLTNSLAINGTGSGSLTLSGALTGAGSLTTSGTNDILAGAGSNIPVLTAGGGSLTLSGGSITTTGDSSPFNCGLNGQVALLTINNGANVSVPSTNANAGITVAGPAGTTMVVDGATTAVNCASYIVVGFGSGGTGQLTVQNSGTVTETTQSLEVGTFKGDNGQVLIQSGGVVNTPNVICGVLSGSAGTVTVTGANSKLTVSGSTLLSFNNGDGNLVVTNGASAALGAVAFGSDPSTLTINGGTATATNLGASTPASATILLSDPAASPALTINLGGVNSYSGSIKDSSGGPGTLVKTGNTLTLSGTLTNTGGYTDSSGILEFSGATVEPQFGSVTAALGATIEYDNAARVFGGFLLGPGTQSLNNATLTGSTIDTGAVVTQTGSAKLVNVTNNGAFINPAGQTLTWTNSTNASAGSLTISGNVNASSMVNDGIVTINSNAQLALIGSTNLVLGGGSRTTLAPTAAITALSGISIELNGGLLNNNGSVGSGATGKVDVNFGGLATGTGTYASVVLNPGGTYSPGAFSASSPLPESAGSFAAIQPAASGATTTGAPITANASVLFTVNGSDSLTLTSPLTINNNAVIKQGTGTVVLPAFVTTSSLNVSAGTMKLSSSVLVLGGLSVSPGATLDLAAQAADISGVSLSTINGLVKQGYAGGAWNGGGIDTSKGSLTQPTAIGVIQNNQNGSPIYSASHLFNGVVPGASDTLLEYTYYGDANLDRVVNAADYTMIDNGLNSHLSGWLNGDFNYDGVINGDDYTLIDNAFNTQNQTSLSAISAGPAQQIASSPVPEPTSLALLAFVAVGLAMRRSRMLSTAR